MDFSSIPDWFRCGVGCCQCGFGLVSVWFQSDFKLISVWFWFGFGLISIWLPADLHGSSGRQTAPEPAAAREHSLADGGGAVSIAGMGDRHRCWASFASSLTCEDVSEGNGTWVWMLCFFCSKEGATTSLLHSTATISTSGESSPFLFMTYEVVVDGNGKRAWMLGSFLPTHY